MENNQNGRQNTWKTKKMEDDKNGRQQSGKGPKRKTK